MIIHRAFIREVLQTSSAVIAILFSIFLVTRIVDFLRQAAEGDIPINSVFLLVLLKMITYLDILVPLVLYISMLLVMGRWIRDNELTVISACGIGMKEFIRPVLILFLVVGAMVAMFSLYLSPLSAEISHGKEYEYRNRTDVTGIPEVLHDGRTGLYVPQRDVAALADACGKLLDDASLRATLAREARKQIEERFDIVNNATRIRELIASVATDGPRGS